MIGRIPILDVQPVVRVAGLAADTPAKAVPGESFLVSATVFREGHEMLGAGVVLTDPAGLAQPFVAMRELAEGTDRYGAEVTAASEGLWHFAVEAWGDPIARWQHDAAIKVPLGQDTELMLTEGALLLRRAAEQISDVKALPAAQARRARAARSALASAAKTLTDQQMAPRDRLAAAVHADVIAALTSFPLRDMLTTSESFPLIVHRQRALFSSWYEFFPRSEGAVLDPTHRRKPQSGTLRTAAKRLDAIAEMGFDVVYVPPVHPIGSTARKGQNNTLVAGPGDPGSPWAIGSPEGGHDTIHPDLGTLDDFDAFVSRASELGLEVAMDLALQASPDHPWVTKHPEWFTTRADGSIAYAENPPKKYQDIYPLNFDNDPDGIYAEVNALVRHWMDHGIRIFRVDNPHTKPLPFWQWLLADIASTDPDVIFLAEAFTRPAMMHALAAIGFHQSYTYFTWRNTASELTEYGTELAGPAAHYMRPNFFVNTPDILCQYLQHAGPSAFAVRAVLAAMLSPSWGVYSGYELCENVPLVPGSEEYLDSEKYAYRPRDWAQAGSLGLTLAPLLRRLNQIRRAHPALHWLRNLRFHHADQPDILCFSKRTHPDFPGPPDIVLVVVNLNASETREATVWLDSSALGLDAAAGFRVTDELTGQEFSWGLGNYVRLDPAIAPAHILTVRSDAGHA
ncbi:MAG TPA: alpha-1,4-glucan--maltose-1-phosphate maltosyltransferase [Streptosporangiaceae bacterium]|nr:alpha-1,4-glucan--maltose-1-phosphate maltosyltransferase [Streptosporangiaceae bacterium]